MVLRRNQFHFARFYLGQIQYIVDQRQQVMGRRLDVTDILVYLASLALLHDNVAQSHDRVHGRPDLMRHIGQKRTLGYIRLLGLLPYLCDLFYVVLRIRHIEDQDDIALFLPEPVPDLLRMSVIISVVAAELFLPVLLQQFPRKITHLFDISSDDTAAQLRKDTCRRRVIADDSLMNVDRNDAVAHAVQQAARCQTAEVVDLPAPDQDHHTRQDKSQHKRRGVVHKSQFHHIQVQHHHRQERKAQYQFILPLRRIVRLLDTHADQRIHRKNIRQDHSAQHEKPVTRPILQSQISMPFRRMQPLDPAVIKSMLITGKNKPQNEDVDYFQNF